MTDDILLEAIRAARERKEQADRDLRLLVAYARELVKPRPYRLVDLAEASGMPIPGVRIAYTMADVKFVTAWLATCEGPAREHGTTAV